jgi:hypothetical protein
MQFNAAEVRFLRLEHAMHGLAPVKDLRELGCPAHIFEKILEQRAKKLGPDFERLRKDAAATAPSPDDLSQRIQSSKLF